MAARPVTLQRAREWMVGALVAMFAVVSMSQALAQTDVSESIDGGLMLSFEGGVPGDNAAIIFRYLNTAHVLPLRIHTISKGESLCSILAELNYPPPCGLIVDLMKRLNGGTDSLDLSQLKVGYQVTVPGLAFSKYTAVRRYESRPGDKDKLNELQSNWGHLGPAELQIGGYASVVTYDAFRTFVATSGDEASLDLASDIGLMHLPNVSVDVVRRIPKEQKVNSSTGEIKDGCISGKLSDPPFDYTELSDYDTSALDAMQPGALSPVDVHLIDEPLLQIPNSARMLNSRCLWGTFDRFVNHSTHLAGIIASPNLGKGFLGLAQNARIDPIEWVKQQGRGRLVPSRVDRNVILGDKLYDVSQLPTPMHVFVAAAQFDDSVPGVKSHLEGVIEDTRQLFIVAAGEEDAGRGAPFSSISAQSPQNLGGLPNVIVVTACVRCMQGDMEIMTEANFSAETSPAIVHVVAPGGEKIPGWIDSSTVGEAAGTSQSAAYVAGAVARMIGRYPNVYVSADRIKKRVIQTSRPIAAMSVAGGLLDPIIMQLDPQSNWLKSNGQWRMVRLAPQPPAFVNFKSRETGVDHPVRPNSIIRVTKLDGGRGFGVYIDLAKADKPLGSVGKLFDVAPDAPFSINTCDEIPVDVSQVEDFIPRVGNAFDDCQVAVVAQQTDVGKEEQDHPDNPAAPKVDCNRLDIAEEEWKKCIGM
ncbi:S8 family peptidase [Mesorhizobium sp. M0387]|uniref:S8 family serine peptidase n=1 Tax=Mesorhizobium sp. M0387 TaxID=2956940 RepID=UPI0033350DC6